MKMKKILIFGGLSVVLVLVIINFGGKWILSRQYRSVPAPEGEEVEGVKIITVTDKDANIKNPKYEFVRLKTLDFSADTNLILDSIRRFRHDSKGNLYFFDSHLRVIKKYTRDYRFIKSIGRKGQGPGEFGQYSNFLISEEDSLYVYDPWKNRLNVFNTDGEYCRSFNFKPSLESRSTPFEIDRKGNIYLSFYDPKTEKVIHKYNSKGNHQKSFGQRGSGYSIPKSFYGYRHLTNFSYGHLVIYNGFLYYSQQNPCQIRKYTLEGDLIMIIDRQSKLVIPHKIEQVGEESFISKIPSFSSGFLVHDDFIFNTIMVTEFVSKEVGSMLDIFTLSGELVYSKNFTDNVALLDNDNNIFYCRRDSEDDFRKLDLYLFKKTE